MSKLCDDAKNGQVCSDDMCRTSPNETLCGFDQGFYNEVVGELADDDAYADGFEPSEAA